MITFSFTKQDREDLKKHVLLELHKSLDRMFKTHVGNNTIRVVAEKTTDIIADQLENL